LNTIIGDVRDNFLDGMECHDKVYFAPILQCSLIVMGFPWGGRFLLPFFASADLTVLGNKREKVVLYLVKRVK